MEDTNVIRNPKDMAGTSQDADKEAACKRRLADSPNEFKTSSKIFQFGDGKWKLELQKTSAELSLFGYVKKNLEILTFDCENELSIRKKSKIDLDFVMNVTMALSPQGAPVVSRNSKNREESEVRNFLGTILSEDRKCFLKKLKSMSKRVLPRDWRIILSLSALISVGDEDTAETVFLIAKQMLKDAGSIWVDSDFVLNILKTSVQGSDKWIKESTKFLIFLCKKGGKEIVQSLMDNQDARNLLIALVHNVHHLKLDIAKDVKKLADILDLEPECHWDKEIKRVLDANENIVRIAIYNTEGSFVLESHNCELLTEEEVKKILKHFRNLESTEVFDFCENHFTTTGGGKNFFTAISVETTLTVRRTWSNAVFVEEKGVVKEAKDAQGGAEGLEILLQRMSLLLDS